MFKKYSANGTVLRAPSKLAKACTKVLLQEGSDFVTQTIHDVLGTALMVIVELRARPLQIAVMIEQLQSAQNLLRAFADQRNDLRGTEKAMPVNQPDDFPVSLCELHGSNQTRAFETGKVDGL